jgi:hypothetical protein
MRRTLLALACAAVLLFCTFFAVLCAAFRHQRHAPGRGRRCDSAAARARGRASRALTPSPPLPSAPRRASALASSQLRAMQRLRSAAGACRRLAAAHVEAAAAPPPWARQLHVAAPQCALGKSYATPAARHLLLWRAQLTATFAPRRPRLQQASGHGRPACAAGAAARRVGPPAFRAPAQGGKNTRGGVQPGAAASASRGLRASALSRRGG